MTLRAGQCQCDHKDERAKLTLNVVAELCGELFVCARPGQNKKRLSSHNYMKMIDL